MLSHWFHSQLALGLAQAATVAFTTLLVAWFASRRAVGLAKEAAWAMVRGLAQIILVGALLALLLRGPSWAAVPVLIAMLVAAASIIRKRAGRIPQAFRLSLVCLCAGAGTTIAVMAVLGIIDPHIKMLIPVGSMVIANNMNIQALFLNRILGEVHSHVGEIESALALGASGEAALQPYLRVAFRASLIPATDNLRSLGIVWIPGIMAGMVLSGSSPLYAALYQFVVLAMIFTSGGITCMAVSRLLPARVFTSREQLLLRG